MKLFATGFIVALVATGCTNSSISEGDKHQSLAPHWVEITEAQRQAIVENVERLLEPYDPTVVAWVELSVNETHKDSKELLGDGRVTHSESREESDKSSRVVGAASKIGSVGVPQSNTEETGVASERFLSEGMKSLEYDTLTLSESKLDVALDSEKSSVAVTISNNKKLPAGGIEELCTLVARASGLPLDQVAITIRPAPSD